MVEQSTSSDDRIIAHLQFARAVASRSIDPRCRGADREDLIAWGLVGHGAFAVRSWTPCATAIR